MKVTFKYGIGTFQGKLDNSVFWPQKSGLASVMRKFTYPKLTIQNEKNRFNRQKFSFNMASNSFRMES